jgi:hypothetical protein
MKYLLPCFLLLSGCVGSAKQTQIQVADAVSAGVNASVLTIKEEYTLQIRTCRVTALSQPDYAMCASQVDERWSHFRDVWRRTRRMQDEYAKALETKDPSLVDYVQWLQTSWCQLKTVAPEGLKLPEVPGLKCEDE